MIEWVINQPFNMNSSCGANPMSREHEYVDLAVLTGEQVDKEWKNSDREAIMEMKHFQIQGIAIEDLWKPTDKYVVIRGVAGIGKSTLIKRYVLKWAREEILNGKENDGTIDFLFFFECRELNTMPNIKSFEELLKVKYPEIFHFAYLSHLQNISDRIMIIVDGLDELQGVYEETQKETSPITEMVKQMIDPKSTILKGHNTIVGGRHSACESIKFKMTQTSIKKVEVVGFNEGKSIEYIEHFFGSDVQRANKVKEMIKRPNIRVMSSSPVLLWIICLLYSEDFEEEINTVTELYVYGLFAFLKIHLRSQENHGNIGLSSFVKSQQFGEIVYSLSALSVKTYMNGQVIFTDGDIGDIGNNLNLETTGLIVKHSFGNFGHQAYQFKHLVFQEFLCSLHLCLTKGVSQYNTNRELSSCTSTILGIHHLVETKNNQIFLSFYHNLKTVHKNSRTFKEYVSNPLMKFTYNKFIKVHKQMIQGYLKKDEFHIKAWDFKLFELMRNFKENDWLIDDDAVKKIQNSKINVFISRHQSAQVLEFLRSLNVVRINSLLLHLSTEEYTEADLDLIRMTELDSFLMVNIGYASYYSSSPNYTGIRISHKKKEIVPNDIKSLYNKFVVNLSELRYSNEISEEDEKKKIDNIFFIVSDLIEHVLENCGNKKLVFINFESSKVIYEIIKQKIRSVYGQREHFENISIME